MKVLNINNNPPPPRKIRALVSPNGTSIYLNKKGGNGLQVLEGGVIRAYGGNITTLEKLYDRRSTLCPVYEGDSIEVQF